MNAPPFAFLLQECWGQVLGCGAKEVGPGTAADKVLPGAEMLEAFDAAVEASPTTIVTLSSPPVAAGSFVT
jgi:hypothetical protein